MKYGFLGAGNICGAVISGAVKGGIPQGDIFIYDINPQQQNLLAQKTGVNISARSEITGKSEILFLGLKPHVLPLVLTEIKEELMNRSLIVVSFAAGVGLERLSELLPNTAIMRVLPNLNSSVGMGMAAYCANSLCSEEQISGAIQFMSASGGVIKLEERFFDIFSVLAGSTPAFTYLYIDSLAKAAHKLGMNKSQALEIAAQAVMGSGRMILDSGEHPLELADRVCSPGGLTIEGICALQERAFESTVVNAVEVAVKKNAALR